MGPRGAGTVSTRRASCRGPWPAAAPQLRSLVLGAVQLRNTSSQGFLMVVLGGVTVRAGGCGERRGGPPRSCPALPCLARARSTCCIVCLLGERMVMGLVQSAAAGPVPRPTRPRRPSRTVRRPVHHLRAERGPPAQLWVLRPMLCLFLPVAHLLPVLRGGRHAHRDPQQVSVSSGGAGAIARGKAQQGALLRAQSLGVILARVTGAACALCNGGSCLILLSHEPTSTRERGARCDPIHSMAIPAQVRPEGGALQRLLHAPAVVLGMCHLPGSCTGYGRSGSSSTWERTFKDAGPRCGPPDVCCGGGCTFATRRRRTSSRCRPPAATTERLTANQGHPTRGRAPWRRPVAWL